MTQTARAVTSVEAPRLKTGWGWVLVAGILLVGTGVVALVSPKLTSLATAINIGAMLLVAGLFAIIGGLVHIRERGGWLVALLGVLSVIAGGLLAFDPFAGAISLVWAIGLWIFVGGIFELGAAFSAPAGSDRVWLILVAIVDLVLGVLIAFMKPDAAIYFLTYFVSASLIVRGVWSISLSMELRQQSRL